MADLKPKRPSEDILNEKTGLSLGVGVIGSVVLFKRRPWPVFVGLGWGLGQSYRDCNRHFNPLDIPGQRLVNSKEALKP